VKSNQKIKTPAPKKRLPAGAAPPAAPPPPPTTQKGSPDPASQPPPPGLDEARHAAAQRSAHGAEVLRANVFPAMLATALNLDKFLDANAYKIYLANVMRDLGDPVDPIERMLVEQLCLAHFRVAQLHGAAAMANGLEATILLNTITARLLGELRRTALSVKAYRTTTVPAKSERAQMRLYKAAQ
jgi:hypothetical protein